MTGRFYQLGVRPTTELPIPQHLRPVVTNTGNIFHGARGIYQAGNRFYGSGVAGHVVGAQTGGPFGSFFNGLFNLLLDVAHVLLIIGGMYLLAKGLAGGLHAF